MRKSLESSVQRKIIKHYEQQGFFVLKVIVCNKKGFPDLILFKDGKTFFIEVKREGEEPKPLQLVRHEQLTNLGFTVKTIIGYDKECLPVFE